MIEIIYMQDIKIDGRISANRNVIQRENEWKEVC